MVRDGEVMDPDSLADVLRQLFKEHKLDKRVRLGVASPRIVVRTLDLPPLKDAKQLAAAVRFKAQEQVPDAARPGGARLPAASATWRPPRVPARACWWWRRAAT